MRYDDKDRESRNVEDRRGQRGGFGFPGGMRRPGGQGRQIRIPMGGGRGGGLSLTTLLIIGAIMLFFGINPIDVLRGNFGTPGMPDVSEIPQLPRTESSRVPGGNNPFQAPSQVPGRPATPEDELARFTKQVLADTEDVWGRVFQRMGKRYEEPRLVLFTSYTTTACGTGQAAMGPFYCPLDRTIYIDLAFYDELHRRFGAPGDFAQAYVIAHEVGHHIQLLLGIAERVQQLKARVSTAQANQLQVRMELQADCLAGVWANLNHQMKDRLEPGDIEEGLRAAAAIGDDTIQRRTTGRVVPDSFTHGTAEQRVRWFTRGFETGNVQACETFNAERL
ncbi:MAG: neutral zinc metallopeptidase [Hyphomicrobiaceae bacterium]